jgi:hypothetical protein
MPDMGSRGREEQATGLFPDPPYQAPPPAAARHHPRESAMIAKTLFLANTIHRIGIKNLRDKNNLREGWVA